MRTNKVHCAPSNVTMSEEHLVFQAASPHTLSPSTNTNLESNIEHLEVDATRSGGMHMTETQSHHDANTSAASLEGESTTTMNMAERTLVEEESKKGHKSGPSTSSLSLPPSKDDDAQKRTSLDRVSDHNANATTTTPTTPTTWDPLNHAEEVEGDRTHGQDKTVVVEEGDDVVDATGKVIYPDEELGRKPVQRRTSHLHLDLKPASPLPWEQVDPPLDNNLKAIAGYYSPGTWHKFRTLQNAG